MVMGEVLNAAPLAGVEIVAVVVGAGWVLVACKPYELAEGAGLGILLIAAAEKGVATASKQPSQKAAKLLRAVCFW